MKLIQLAMLTLGYVMISALIVNAATGVEAIDIPTLDIPTFDFIDLTGGCSSFTDCTEYLANVIYNIGLGAIALVQTVFALIAFIVNISGLIIDYGVQGIDGAPVWWNIILGSYLAMSIAVIVYRMVRAGGDSA